MISKAKSKQLNNIGSDKQVWNVLLQMLLGLFYLHNERNILHRDLKSANVFLSRGETDQRYNIKVPYPNIFIYNYHYLFK